MKRTALATWQGGYKSGRGTVTILDAGLSDVPFSYSSRFEGETALSPEGLIAAAHATSFAMAFAQQMESKHLKTERIDIVATVKVEEIDSLQTISEVALEIIVYAPMAGNALILQAANLAMTHCSVSRLINAKITLDARVMAPRYRSRQKGSPQTKIRSARPVQRAHTEGRNQAIREFALKLYKSDPDHFAKMSGKPDKTKLRNRILSLVKKKDPSVTSLPGPLTKDTIRKALTTLQIRSDDLI